MPVRDLPELPIDEVLSRFDAELARCGSVVLRAPTGAGKTTRIPVAILDAATADGQIIMLEPRRLAARAAAARIAEELRVPLGRDVGYQVRFDSRSSDATRILVVTEGILLRKLQSDPFLSGIGAVVFDEFHERNLASDLALGMVQRIQLTVRDDLKIIVMSATLDPNPISRYLGNAAIVESQGRSFPVEIAYRGNRQQLKLGQLAAAGVEQIFKKTNGHVLVFLPGVGEIHQTQRELDSFAGRHSADLMPLYGDLPPAAQDAVLASSGNRKIVLATNVAETSITIPGVTGVVDTGLARILRFDPVAGLDRLELEPISKSSADQRAGRAGRTQPGICLRLWDEVAHRHRPDENEPEIRRVDLAGPVLQLKCWGETDVLAFPWFESPRPDAVEQAELLLQRLGACTTAGRVTALGQQMVQLPVHPRIAKLLLTGHELGIPRWSAWLAALLEERDPFFRSRTSQSSRPMPLTVSNHHSPSDVLDRLVALQEAESQGASEFPWGTLNRSAARQIARVRDQLQSLLKTIVEEDASAPVMGIGEALSRALVAAFPDRVAKRRSIGSEKGLMVGGRGVKLAAQSAVRTGELFLCVDVDAGQTDALVRQASLVEADWLPEASRRVQTDLFFHPTQKQVVARRREYFEDLVLSESPCGLPEDDRPAELLFQEARHAWEQVFPVQESSIQGFLQRVRCLGKWKPELALPPFAESQKLEVLRSLCERCRSFAELKKADWLAALQARLTWPQRQILDQEAPESLSVPSGSRIRLEYAELGPPVLSVRIQEIFGLKETPRIAGGRVPVLLHLLAPNRQPQQVTEDLASFWKNTYPSVRKELARRYPRHPWPEDPLAAKAIRK